MVQVPAAITVTVVPLTVQTAVVEEVNVTVNPELAVAETVNGATPKVWFARALNVMV